MEKGGRERRRESDAIFSRLLSRPPFEPLSFVLSQNIFASPDCM